MLSLAEISSQLLTPSSKGFTSTLTWTATDSNTASWSSGSIITSDGVVYSIQAGNTGNIASMTFVYLDADTSVIELQVTTTVSTAVGNNKVLIAVVQTGAAGANCIIDVIGSYGSTIDADRIVTGKLESADGKTYFDLDNDIIIINDGTNDRIAIGSVGA